MKKARQEFSLEFKREAPALLGSSRRPQTPVAAEPGLQPSMPRSWRAIRTGTPPRAPPTSAATTGRIASLADLASENAKLRREPERRRPESNALKRPSASSRRCQGEVRLHQDHQPRPDQCRPRRDPNDQRHAREAVRGHSPSPDQQRLNEWVGEVDHQGRVGEATSPSGFRQPDDPAEREAHQPQSQEQDVLRRTQGRCAPEDERHAKELLPTLLGVDSKRPRPREETVKTHCSRGTGQGPARDASSATKAKDRTTGEGWVR